MARKEMSHMPAVATNRAQLFKIEFDREEDGRWIADVPDLPGVLVYGDSKKEALAKAEALALRVLADRIEETGEPQLEVRFAPVA
jgi:predicted RNase H-like HicB family nuclease